MFIIPRIHVHPLSFMQRNGDGCQRYCWFRSWSCFGNKFPSSSILFIFNGFCRFGLVLFNSIDNANPRSGSVLKQRSDLNFNTFTIFMMTNMKIQDWANFHIPTNPASRPSSRIVSRQRIFSTTVFKPASEHSLDNFWLSDSRSNCCSYSCNKFTRRCSSVRGSAVGGHSKHGTLDEWFLRIQASCLQQFYPRLHQVYQSKFRTISFLIQVPEWPMTARKSASIIRNCNWIILTCLCISLLSPFNVVEHWHEDDTLLFLSWILESVRGRQMLWILWIFSDIHRFSIDAIQIFQMITPESFYTSQTDHRVGKDVGFGTRDTTDFVTQQPCRAPCVLFVINLWYTNDLSGSSSIFQFLWTTFSKNSRNDSWQINRKFWS